MGPGDSEIADFFNYLHGQQFNHRDMFVGENCPNKRFGGWWYESCPDGNYNGAPGSVLYDWNNAADVIEYASMYIKEAN